MQERRQPEIETRPVRSQREERRKADKPKEFIIKFTIVMLPIAICVHCITYGKLMEKQYDLLKAKIFEYDSIIELRNDID